MSDRLRHLQRQQALLREHLVWIEAEIAREANTRPAAPATPPTSLATSRTTPNATTPLSESQSRVTSPAHPPASEQLTPAVAAIVAPSAAASDSAAPAPDADELLQRFASEERLNPEAARRGCLLAFSAGLLLLVGAVVLAWIAYYRH